MDIFIESKKENGRGPAALQLGPFAECCYAFQSRTGIIGDTGGGRREKTAGFLLLLFLCKRRDLYVDHGD